MAVTAIITDAMIFKTHLHIRMAISSIANEGRSTGIQRNTSAQKQIFHKLLPDRWRDSRSSLAMTSLALCLRHAVSAYTLPSGGCGYMKYRGGEAGAAPLAALLKERNRMQGRAYGSRASPRPRRPRAAR